MLLLGVEQMAGAGDSSWAAAQKAGWQSRICAGARKLLCPTFWHVQGSCNNLGPVVKQPVAATDAAISAHCASQVCGLLASGYSLRCLHTAWTGIMECKAPNSEVPAVPCYMALQAQGNENGTWWLQNIRTWLKHQGGTSVSSHCSLHWRIKVTPTSCLYDCDAHLQARHLAPPALQILITSHQSHVPCIQCCFQCCAGPAACQKQTATMLSAGHMLHQQQACQSSGNSIHTRNQSSTHTKPACCQLVMQGRRSSSCSLT